MLFMLFLTFFQVFSLAVRCYLVSLKIVSEGIFALFLASKSNIFFSLLLYRFLCSFLFSQTRKFTMLSHAICLYIFSELPFHKLWLTDLWILSLLPSDCWRSSIVLFLSVPRVAFPSLLVADCLLVADDGLFSFTCRRSIFVSRSNFMMLWSLLILFGTIFQLIFLSSSVPLSDMILILDSLYPWYINGYSSSFAIWSPKFHSVSSTISPFWSVIEEK